MQTEDVVLEHSHNDYIENMLFIPNLALPSYYCKKEEVL
jgi:hypothetical protein